MPRVEVRWDETIALTVAAARQFDALPVEGRSSVADALHAYAMSGRGDVKRLIGRRQEARMRKPQIITVSSGEELVVVTKAKYQALVEAAEELADIAAFDAAKADVAGSRPLTAEESAKVLGRG